MKRVLAALAALLVLGSALPAFAAAKPSPTPPPLEIETEVIRDVPEEVQQLLDLAYSELEETNGKNLGKRNKYTKWRNNGEWGWCGGFITWCLLELGVPQKEWAKTETGEVEGLRHVKEGGVGKLVTGYLRMNRTTMIPQKGFIAVFGNGSNKYVQGMTPNYHVGLVWDVELLESGVYRVTTIEGNVSLNFTDGEGKRHKAAHTVRMYTRDYDPNAELKKNVSLVPEEERDREESVLFSYGYTYNNPALYISKFLMPWVPSQYPPADEPAADAPAEAAP